MTIENSTVKTKIKKIFKITIYGFSAIYLAIWLFSPFAFKYFINDYLEVNHSLTLSNDSGIRYNPFTSHLTISDLEIINHEKVLFSIKTLEAEIRLHRLIFDEVYISEFIVNGLYIESKNESNILLIAGIEINSTSQSNSNKEPLSNVLGATQKKYKIFVPKLTIENADLQYYQNNMKHLFVINKLVLSKLVLSNTEKSLNLKLDAGINSAPVELDVHLSLLTLPESIESLGKGDIEFNLFIKQYDLSNVMSLLLSKEQKFDALLSFKSHHRIRLDGNTLDIETDKMEINIDDISYQDRFRLFTQEFQRLYLKNSNISIDLGSKELFRDFNIESLALNAGKNKLKQDKLIFFNKGHSLGIEKIFFGPESDQNELIFGNVQWEIMGLSLAQTGRMLTSEGGTFDISRLSASNTKLQIEDIVYDGLNAKFVLSSLDKPKGINVEQNPSPNNEHHVEANTTIEQKTEPHSSEMAIVVDSVRLINSKMISFIDESAKPIFSQSIILEEFSLSNLDSMRANNESPFKIAGKSGEYTKFDFEGFIKPFTQEVNLAVKGELTELSLPPASSYIEQALGFHVESGELDTKIDIKVLESEIDGNTEVLIKGLSMGAAENYDQELLLEQTAMPLNVALGMLKDRDDNVELDIPLMGNLNSPTFGFSSFISLVTKKAIQSAATSYLVKTFLPYAEVISLTISAGDFILKTRFEDLYYSPAQIKFDEKQSNYMQQFVNLMKDKKSTRVKVCAISTSIDLLEKYKQLSKEEVIVKLKIISSERMEYFKAYAVEKGIDSARILLCNPKVDLDEKSQGKLEISV